MDLPGACRIARFGAFVTKGKVATGWIILNFYKNQILDHQMENKHPDSEKALNSAIFKIK